MWCWWLAVPASCWPIGSRTPDWAGQINASIMLSETRYPNLAAVGNWKSYKSATWLAFATFAGLSFWAGIGLARGRDASVVVRAKIVLWLIGPIASFVVGMLVPLLAFGKPLVDVQVVSNIVASAITAAIWTTYLSKSKRVRATYAL